MHEGPHKRMHFQHGQESEHDRRHRRAVHARAAGGVRQHVGAEAGGGRLREPPEQHEELALHDECRRAEDEVDLRPEAQALALAQRHSVGDAIQRAVRAATEALAAAHVAAEHAREVARAGHAGGKAADAGDQSRQSHALDGEQGEAEERKRERQEPPRVGWQGQDEGTTSVCQHKVDEEVRPHELKVLERGVAYSLRNRRSRIEYASSQVSWAHNTVRVRAVSRASRHRRRRRRRVPLLQVLYRNQDELPLAESDNPELVLEHIIGEQRDDDSRNRLGAKALDAVLATDCRQPGRNVVDGPQRKIRLELLGQNVEENLVHCPSLLTGAHQRRPARAQLGRRATVGRRGDRRLKASIHGK